MTERRYAVVTASAGVVLFILCSLVAQGGPLAHGTFGDVYEYHLYQQHMAAGQWPYRNFFDEYPPLAQPLSSGIELLPGPFFYEFKWAMVVCGICRARETCSSQRWGTRSGCRDGGSNRRRGNRRRLADGAAGKRSSSRPTTSSRHC